MCGCCTLAATSASRWKRRPSSSLCAVRNLTATKRPILRSQAFQTSPMPPLPRNWTRTYLPIMRAGSFIASMTSAGGLRWPVAAPAGLGLSLVGPLLGRVGCDGTAGLEPVAADFLALGGVHAAAFEDGGVIWRGVGGPAGLGLSSAGFWMTVPPQEQPLCEVSSPAAE